MVKGSSHLTAGTAIRPNRQLWNQMKANRYIYLLLVPGLACLIIYSYVPMYGILLAFKDHHFNKGILMSPWVGFDNFKYIFEEKEFWAAVKNTFVISFGKIIIGFPAPIILAILLNEIREGKFKKTLQTIFTFPNFLSWIIVSGFILNIFSASGVVNSLLTEMGYEAKRFLGEPNLFPWIIFISDVWKGAGWSSIIYLATITGIDPSLYEAAEIDGANRWHRILYITWPSIKSVAVLLLIIAVGNCMNAGFDQVFNLYNPLVYSTGDIIDTYIYRISFQGNPSFGVSTAVGLFKSVVNFALLFCADRVAKLSGERGIF